MNATDLYADGPAAGAKAKILLIHFDGAIDAGAAGRIAIGQMLRSLRRLHDLEGDYKVLPGHEGISSLSEERAANPYMAQAVGRR